MKEFFKNRVDHKDKYMALLFVVVGLISVYIAFKIK